MKTIISKTVAIFSMLQVSMGLVYAETPIETTEDEGCVAISELFLSPIGIEQSLDQLDSTEIEECLMKEGLDYKKMNMGAYGTVISVYPKNFLIGGVGMARIIFILNEYAKMIMYESVQTEDYFNVCKAVEENLEKYAVSKDLPKNEIANPSTLMLSDSLGVSVGFISEKQISIIYIMDMNNLKGFLNQ